MSEKGIIHISMMNNWASHILFLRKRVLIVHLAALIKGGYFGTHIHTMSYIGSSAPLLCSSKLTFSSLGFDMEAKFTKHKYVSDSGLPRSY